MFVQGQRAKDIEEGGTKEGYISENNDNDVIKQEDETERKRQNSVDLSAADFGSLIHDTRQTGIRRQK